MLQNTKCNNMLLFQISNTATGWPHTIATGPRPEAGSNRPAHFLTRIPEHELTSPAPPLPIPLHIQRHLTSRIAVRLRAARERAGFTQYQLAVGLGVNHRQIVARVEAGQRSLTAEELIRAMDLFGVDLDYFTDPFRMDGEGEFTFRGDPDVAGAAVDEFERRAGRWIATYRELSREQDPEPEPRWLELKLALSRRSSFGDAEDAGEAFAERMELGDCPGAALRQAMEERLGVLVLDVDAPAGIASAAFRVRGLKCVLLNRHESEGHRNYELAHGLFHLLTWDAIPPTRLEPSRVPRRGKAWYKAWYVARLAESFATALLMLSREQAAALNDRRPGAGGDLAASGAPSASGDPAAGGSSRSADAEAPAFSAEFVRCVADALDAGSLSVRRAASVLDLSLPELASLLTRYGHKADFKD